MKELIIDATREALHGIRDARFFRTERGFHGAFYCALMKSLSERELLTEDTLLEMEYQKSARHVLYERPDIVLHKPAEITGAAVSDNNYAVWALKRHASGEAAADDFGKLDSMFSVLKYPLGFFINIDASDHYLRSYEGPFPERLYGCAVWLDQGNPTVRLDSITRIRQSG